MADASGDPVEVFDMHLAHVGINATSDEEAHDVARRFETLMGLATREMPPSYFAGTLVEVMKGSGRGTKGHIGFHVNDLDAAAAWFSARGFEVDESSRAFLPDGSPLLVYFKDEIAGFAIHLTTAD